MFSTLRILAFATLAASVAQSATLLEAAEFASEPGSGLDLTDTPVTDTTTIQATIAQVDQKTGVDDSIPPGAPPADTVVTAADGEVFDVPVQPGQEVSGSVQARQVPGRFMKAKRSASNYVEVFSGTGTLETDRDGSIQGTAYLTYTLINNATYDVDACLDFCTGVNGCVFANLYYEYNNPGLDRGSSNLKCAVYGDVHSAAEKTNRGGQEQEPGYGLTYIQHSSGWRTKTIPEPTAPEGYELVWQADGAANAPGYMGFTFLSSYDVDACARECNSRGEDGQGGRCQFFNIWRATVKGDPTAYSCSMYFVVSDVSTANNFGQGDLKVTYSRAYQRINYIIDGGFEEFTCKPGAILCFTQSTPNWIGTSPVGGSKDVSIFSHAPFARTGRAAATFGSASGLDDLPGTLKPAKALKTKAGVWYTIQYWHQSSYNGQLEADAFLEVSWNGQVVDTIRPGNSPWTRYELRVLAQGNDQISFRGGKYPAYSFLDDVYVLAGVPS